MSNSVNKESLNGNCTHHMSISNDSFNNHNGLCNSPMPGLQNAGMKCFSIFSAPISNVIPFKSSQISEVFNLIRSNQFEPQTRHLRSIVDPKEANTYKASNFDYATFSGCFRKRALPSLIRQSPYVCIDIDKIGDIETVNKAKKSILGSIKPALLFISPSGNGLKVIFEINTNDGTHYQYFKALEVYFKEVVQQKIDTSGSDISRACFLSQDEEAYYNDGPDILDLSFLDTFSPNEEKGENPESDRERENLNFDDSPSEIYNRLEKWMNKKETFYEGNRNGFITRLANACNRYGISISYTMQRLNDYAETGFTRKEIEAIVRSVYSHTERHHISSFTEVSKSTSPNSENDKKNISSTSLITPPLPIRGFPFHMQELIKECARVYRTHQDFWAISFLQATAIALGCTYQIKDKYNNGAILWAAMVAPSGIGKSEPFSIAFQPIFKADSEAEEIFNREMADYNYALALSPKERKEQEIELPEKPVQRQYVVVDTTPEGLIDALKINRRGLLIAREELLGWISDFGRYNRSGEVQNMLSSWSEKFFKVTRKGAGSSTIEKPFIPIFGGIQPGKLSDLAKDGRAHDGFMQRFIFAYPDQVLKQDYNEDILGDQYQSYYNDYILRLLSTSGYRNPVLLSDEAKQHYKEFFNDNTKLVNEESCEYTRAVYQKLEIIVLRISLILHASNHVYDGQFDHPIQAGTMQAAIEMTEYFRITAKKVQQQIGINSINSVKIDTQSVAEFMMSKGRITKSALAEALGTSRSQLDRLLEKSGTKVQ